MKKILILLYVMLMSLLPGLYNKVMAQCDSIAFPYVKDSVQTWTVPANVTSVMIKLWGAGGGSGYQNYYNDAWCGGAGAYMEGTLSGAALAGQTLTLYVPSGGAFSNSGNGGAGGWPGGGIGGNDQNFSEWGAGGGGYAAIQIAGNYYVVVGGGGGGGSTEYGGVAYGGGGGATTGGTGSTTFGYSGTGGTISSGGTGGAGYSLYGDNGSFLTGGNGEAQSANGDYGGGGGGGGYYGGGGGGDEGNGGGGGSSYPASPVTISGITFTPTLNIQGPMNPNTFGSAIPGGSPYISSTGTGNIDANGGNGLIIIYYYFASGVVLRDVPCRNSASGNAYVSVNGGIPPYTYSWSNGATTDTILSVKGGIYTVNVTDSAGCTATASVDITQPNVLIDSAMQAGHINCFGEVTGMAASIVTGGTTPYTYNWSPSGGSTDSAKGISAGTYTLTVTDPCHDTAITTVTITQPALLTTTPTQIGDILCHGGSQAIASAMPAGGSGLYTYMWNTGFTKDTITGLKAITYTVTVTDSNGCTASASVLITQPAVLKLSQGTLPDTGSCAGMAWLNVSGGTVPYSFLWSDGNTTDTIMECSGTYCCTVTDAHGCVNYDCATILSTAGVQNVINGSSIKMYPDPSTGQFDISGMLNGNIVEVYNYMGQIVTSVVADNSSITHINISAQANGIYMVRILSNRGALISERKIVKME
jgi:hypothetical protein